MCDDASRVATAELTTTLALGDSNGDVRRGCLARLGEALRDTESVRHQATLAVVMETLLPTLLRRADVLAQPPDLNAIVIGSTASAVTTPSVDDVARRSLGAVALLAPAHPRTLDMATRAVTQIACASLLKIDRTTPARPTAAASSSACDSCSESDTHGTRQQISHERLVELTLHCLMQMGQQLSNGSAAALLAETTLLVPLMTALVQHSVESMSPLPRAVLEQCGKLFGARIGQLDETAQRRLANSVRALFRVPKTAELTVDRLCHLCCWCCFVVPHLFFFFLLCPCSN